MGKLILRDFSIGYLIALALAAVLGGLAFYFLNFDPGAGISVAVLLAALYYAAFRHAQRGGRPVNGVDAWRISLSMMLIALVISLLVAMMVVLFISPPDERTQTLSSLSQLGPGLLAAGAAIIGGIHLVVIRLSFPWMVRTSIRLIERKRSG